MILLSFENADGSAGFLLVLDDYDMEKIMRQDPVEVATSLPPELSVKRGLSIAVSFLDERDMATAKELRARGDSKGLLQLAVRAARDIA